MVTIAGESPIELLDNIAPTLYWPSWIGSFIVIVVALVPVPFAVAKPPLGKYLLTTSSIDVE